MAAIPFLASLALNGNRLRAEARALAERRLLGTAELVAARLAAELDGVERVLWIVAQSVPLDASRIPGNDETLLEVRGVLPGIATGVHVYDAEGRNLGSSHRPLPPRNDGAAALVRGRRYFTEARRTHALSFGSPVRSLQDSTLWIVSLAVPMRDPRGRFQGAAVAPIELRRLAPLLSSGVREPATVLTLVDGERLVLGRTRADRVALGASLPADAAHARADADTSGVVFIADAPDGRSRVLAFAPVEGTPWRVLASLPASVVYATADAQFRGGLVVLVIAILAAGAAAFVVARSVERPLVALAGDADKLAAGELAHRSAVRSGDLIGRLAEAFNRMAESLSGREASLVAAQRRYRLLFERTPLALLVVESQDGVVRDANDAAGALFRAGGERLVGRKLNELIEMPAADPSGCGPLRVRGGGGRQAWVECSALELPAEGGVPARLLALRDVTEEHEARLALEESEREVRQMQKLEAVTSVATSVAHDFNNMLTAILGASEMALGSDGARDDGRLLQDLHDIRDAAQRASDLTRRLLLFTRRAAAEVRPVDVAALVRGLSGMLRRLLGETVTLRTEVPAQPCVVSADAAQLEQVVVNLVVNARDALADGGPIAVRVRWEPAAGEDASAHVVLEVEDWGRGMDDATRARVFEPFFTTKPAGRGTGLGLPVVQRIVSSAGGRLSLRSAPGAGTCVTVRLPAIRDSAPADARRSPVAGLPAVGASLGRVLLVDDNVDVRRVTARTLAALGYEVTEAEGGEAALRAVQGGAPRFVAVVTDVVMPGMHGRALRDALRALAPDLPVLFVTGHADDEPLMAEAAEGSALVLRKPFSMAALAAALDRTVRAVRTPGAASG